MTDEVRCVKHNMTLAEHGDPDPYDVTDEPGGDLELAHCIGTCDPALCCDGRPDDGAMWTEHPPIACVDADKDPCEGIIVYRREGDFLTGRSWPRCEHHWTTRG